MKLLIPLLSLLFVIVQASAQSDLDTTYTPAMSQPAKAVGIQADGKVVTGGDYRDFVTTGGSTMFRFNSDGTRDTTFNYLGNTLLTSNHGNISEVNSVTCFLNGNVAISGAFDQVNGIYAPKVVVINEAGFRVNYAMPFSSAVSWIVTPFIVSLPDNGAYAYGAYTLLNLQVPWAGIMRLKSDGNVDTAFQPRPGTTSTGTTSEIDAAVNCMVRQPDGSILVAGEFDRFNSQVQPYLVRITSKGVLDPTFNPSPDGNCNCIALQPDGKILVSGYFSSIGGSTGAFGLARLNADGTRDTSFTPNSISTVWSMIVRADGKIAISGGFATINGSSRYRLALLTSTGALDPAYSNAGANDYVTGIAIQNDGKIVISGNFINVGSTSRSYLARMNADVPAVNDLVIDPEGKYVEWQRSGSAPEVDNAEFRYSTDGKSYSTLLGSGVRITGGWRLSGLGLPGNKTFYIQAKGLSRGGFYNSSTSVMKSVATFKRPLPTIDTQPVSQTVIVGNTGVQFLTAVTSAAAVKYQWKRNGSSISGATSATYMIPGAVASSQAGTYTCTITSSAGSVTTQGAVLTVVTPITIVKPPAFQAVLAGKAATFSVTVTGSSPLYQWQKDGSDILGQTASTLKIPVAEQPRDEGVYRCVVRNFAGPQTSAGAQLYVVDTAVGIPVAPPHGIFALGQTAVTLTTPVVSESPPVLQWLKNSKAISGATSGVLSLPLIKLTDSGKYALKGTNPMGTFTSGIAELAVVDRLSTKRFVIGAGGLVKMTAIATGNGLTYKWKKGSADVVEAAPNVVGTLTNALSLKSLTTADSGIYTCEVTGPGGMLPSAEQTLIVTNHPPAILSSFDLPIAMVNADYDYPVPMDATSEWATAKFGASGLPPGLKMDPVTGHIIGRPTKAGSYFVTVTAKNDNGDATPQADTLTVLDIPTGFIGSYIGVATPDTNSATFRLGARVEVTTTTAGSYSGKIYVGTASWSFNGGRLNVGVSFNNTNLISVPRKGLPTLTLRFNVNPTTLLLTGSVENGSDTAPLSGWKRKWSSSVPASDYKGYYTSFMRVPAPAPADYSYPRGDGYVAWTVADAGTLTVTGKLADGAAFSTSGGFLGPNGQVAVYGAPYGATGGIVAGALSITPVGTAPDFLSSTVGGTLDWIKYPGTGTTYPAGFGALALTVSGAEFAKPVSGNLMNTNPILYDQAVLFSGAHIETDVLDPNTVAKLSATNALSPIVSTTSNPAAVTLSLSATTGILSGGFTLNEDTDPGPAVKNVKRPAKIFGILVRDVPNNTGHCYGSFTLIQSPGSATSAVLSGKMSVD